MTNYNVYIRQIYIGKATVQSYLGEAEKVNAAIRLLNKLELKDGLEDRIDVSRHSIHCGSITLIESFD
jgi:hypothetical protein